MKITGGIAGGIPLDVLKGNRTRPTTDRIRESLFGSLRDRVEGARVLDLFAGSGALGLEAASRGAARVDFVEKHAGTSRNIEHNAGKLPKAGVDAVLKIHTQDSLRYLKSAGLEKVDLIFADPPYAYFEQNGVYETLLQSVGKAGILKPGGLMIVESSSRVNLPDAEGWNCIKTKNYGASTLSFWELHL